MTRKTSTFVVALVIALLVAGALWMQFRPEAPGQTELTMPVGAPSDPAAMANLPAVPELVLGEATAPVTIVEYASYTCPHCANFHEGVFKDLKRDYIDTGKVRFVFREVYFDRYGLWAAMVARCGGETRYFGIMSMLFDGQETWVAGATPQAVIDNLRRIGRTAGMDDAAMDVCLKDAAMAEAMTKTFEANMAADQVKGTPTLIINGTTHKNMNYDDLKSLIDAELANG